jgi:hypothetical protein
MIDDKNEFEGFEEPDTDNAETEAEEIDEEIEQPEKVAELDDSEDVAMLSLDVIEEAIGYGLTAQEIKRLGSEDNIALILAIMDRQIETAANAEKSESAYDDDDDPFADPDENTGVNSEIADLRKQVEALTRSIKNESERPNLDKLFGLLDDDYDDLFGEVGGDHTKTHIRNRNKVAQELDTIKAGYKARKRAIPSDRRLFKQAVRSVFGDHESKIVKKKFSESAEKRKSQFISRVNSRDTRRPDNTRDSAIDSVKKFLADRGYSDLESVETFE